MPRSRKDVSVSDMCETAVRLADEVGDREVARRIGVSQTTIGNWRRGKKQNTATVPKLERWFAREGHKHYKSGTSVAEAFLAVKAIVNAVSAKRRRAVARRIDDIVRDEYNRASVHASPTAGGHLRKRIDSELR